MTETVEAIKRQPALTRFEFRAVSAAVGERAFRMEDRLIPVYEALRYAESHAELRRRTAAAAAVRALLHAAVQRIRQFWAAVAGRVTSDEC